MRKILCIDYLAFLIDPFIKQDFYNHVKQSSLLNNLQLVFRHKVQFTRKIIKCAKITENNQISNLISGREE